MTLITEVFPETLFQNSTRGGSTCTAEFRGQGLGRRLIEHALDYFRREGLAYAMIETMAQNEAGQHLYPACGFVEVARQVHFVKRL
jgi:ribosomal protein S18 acetylase RimI-like enzyme